MEMQSFKKKIPNLITGFRILLLIPILVVMLVPQLTTHFLWSGKIAGSNIFLEINLGYIIAFVLFLIASISDFLDGYLARKWNVVSTFGKIFDPIADKILINSIMIVLVAQYKILIVLVVLMIVRDIVVDAFRIYAVSNKIDVAADFFGKLKTVLQMLAICFVLVISSQNTSSLFPNSDWWFYAVQNIFFYGATIASLYSMFNYSKKIFKPNNSTELIGQ